jgi:hypothetical protein
MKMLTEQEYEQLLSRAHAFSADVKATAVMLVAEAERQGLVLTIEQEPLKPLAMGHYKTVVSVRPKMKAAPHG